MSEPRAASPPAVVGRYAVYGEIAAGGMATVHLGRLIGQAGFSRTVAIKRLHRMFVEEPEFAAMLLDEARLASRVRHPNVVPTLDVVATGSELFLVMEYVHGLSLAVLLREMVKRRERLDPRIAVAVHSDVLQGLHAAHEATDENGALLGIVHRDVSPQNVLVGVDGSARVLDFGVAKARGRLQTTHDGRLKGKLAYMAPEQLRSRGCDRRSDVFAAGIVLWELLTGRRLFTADTEGEIVEKVLNQTIDAPSKVRPDLDDRFDAVTMRALEREPDRRYPTAREMSLELETCQPPASTAQVSGWVESLGGEMLASRQAQVHAVESSPALAAAAGAEIELTPAAGDRRAAPARADGGSGVSTAHLAVTRPSQRVQAPPSNVRRLVTTVAVAGAVAGIAITLMMTSRGARTSAAAPSAAVVAATSPVSVSGGAATAPPPPSASTETAAVPADATSVPSAAASPSIRPAPRPAPASAPAHAGSKPVDCTDPYTRDELGRKIYKLECLH